MKAVKRNKQYTIDETQKKHYVESGYDIYDDKGKLIENGRGKTVSYEEHMKVVEELEALKAEISENGKTKQEKK